MSVHLSDEYVGSGAAGVRDKELLAPVGHSAHDERPQIARDSEWAAVSDV